MSIRRLLGTATAMTLFALALAALTPDVAELTGTLAAPQRTTDTLGPDAVVTAVAVVTAWAVWTWGALGLALTAGSALPGLVGAVFRGVLRVVVPAGARHSAALLLGAGLGVAAPLLPAAPTFGSSPTAAATPAGEPVPDWPAAPATGEPVPDWPPAAPLAAPVPDRASPDPAGEHVVVRGDCLWHVAEARLQAEPGRIPTDGDIADAVHRWWTANADVIGPDPDLLLPGQVLRPPGRP